MNNRVYTEEVFKDVVKYWEKSIRDAIKEATRKERKLKLDEINKRKEN